MKKIFTASIIIIAFLLVGCCGQKTNFTPDELVKAAKKETTKITAEDLFKRMDNDKAFTLLDVRTAREHNHGYIPGSALINRGTLEFKILNKSFWKNKDIDMPEKEENIVVYCKKGGRSILAAKTLKKLGFKNVTYLDGGFKKWELTYPDRVDKNLEALGGGGEKKHDMGGGC